MAETLPPLTANDIRKYLNDDSFTVYLYIGNKKDRGWKIAMLAYGAIPKLRIYLVKDIGLIREWVGQKNPKGVVFGYDDEPKSFLNKAQAEDAIKVFDAIYKGGLK
jgi:hypothetical protein